jgi:prevent-host-death family protein
MAFFLGSMAFGGLIDLARAKPVAVAKHGRPVVVVMAIEENEQLNALDLRKSPNGQEDQT